MPLYCSKANLNTSGKLNALTEYLSKALFYTLHYLFIFLYFNTRIERFNEFFLSILSFKDSVDQLRMK